MQITLLGTGSPVPILERGGTAILLSLGERNILIDCGQKTVHRLLENETDISEIEELFFTHHHIDHNSDFYNFVISSWSMGRTDLTVYGPSGTDDLLESLHTIYDEDIQYRKQMEYATSGIDDIDVELVDEDFRLRDEQLQIDVLPVDHSIETYGYRFTANDSGNTFVFSADTRKLPELADFAADADILVQDACLASVDEEYSSEGFVWDRLTKPYPQKQWDRLHKTHCTAREAGEIAAEADVDTLVLTHLLPYRDLQKMEEAAADVFEGDVIVGYDNLSLEV
ncbi:MBL fold metallo-hydrolase [Halobellus captivus]|uniref:MBL fold metallo-hydrolase n=1 Tax=Halobellus captivus TaxID=2592614 RepID=UPI0011A898EA|nr:MBL fold metallo-hydrolase [Halobellus captivus]